MSYWEELELRLMELEEELDASGVEDALEWEKFPEMERIMYAIAEHELKMKAAYGREIAAEVAERDEIIETVEMSEVAAMVELEQFGYIEGEFDERRLRLMGCEQLNVAAAAWDDMVSCGLELMPESL